jgi:hypothetical protein
MEHDTIEFIDNLPVCTGTKVKKCITGVASLLYWRKKRESIYQYVPAKMMQTFLSKKNACENHIMWIGKEGYSQKKGCAGSELKLWAAPLSLMWAGSGSRIWDASGRNHRESRMHDVIWVHGLDALKHALLHKTYRDSLFDLIATSRLIYQKFHFILKNWKIRSWGKIVYQILDFRIRTWVLDSLWSRSGASRGRDLDPAQIQKGSHRC